jgi:hypothetical protein
MQGVSWLAEQLFVSQEGLFSMEWVSKWMMDDWMKNISINKEIIGKIYHKNVTWLLY